MLNIHSPYLLKKLSSKTLKIGFRFSVLGEFLCPAGSYWHFEQKQRIGIVSVFSSFVYIVRIFHFSDF